MKRLTKCLLTTMLFVLMFGMTSQAAVKSVTITQPTNKASYTVYRSKKNVSKKIKATVKTTSKKDSKKLTYTSSNPDVVSVSASGKITCKKNGKATITVASKQDPKKKDTIKITVVQRATKLTADASGYEIKSKKTLTMTKGKSTKVTITAAPEGASNKVTWKSSNTKIAKVDKKGNISAKKAGTATITATAKDGSKTKISFKVKVVTGKVTSVSVDKSEVALVVGGTAEEATATVTATVATSGKKASKAVGWESKNEKVATVKNGVITAVAPGETTVTVMAVDGSKKKATVKVTVTQKPEETKPAEEPTPTPDPEPAPTVYTKILTVNKDAFTEGFTVAADKTMKWDTPQKALDALNAATKDNTDIIPQRVLTGTNVIANGKNYTLRYDKTTSSYSLKNAEGEDILLDLLDASAGDVIISNVATEQTVDTYLRKVFAGKHLLYGPYDFGTGTVIVDGKNYKVSKFIIENGDVETTINGSDIKIVMTNHTTITVTSDKPLDSNMEAVKAMLQGAYN